MDRVSEEERGRSQSSEMRGTGKGEEGFFMKGRGRRKQNVMDLMNGWWLCMNVCIGVLKSWRVTRQVECKKR